MPCPHRAACLRVLFVVLAAVALPVSAWPWGGATHVYIAQHYSQHLPPELHGLRAYDDQVVEKVNDPDRRKGQPGFEDEAYRHYIDIDYYPEFLDGTLPHDRAALEAEYGAGAILDQGVLPWAVGDVVTRLTTQFADHDWTALSTTIADLCHYVGDANQPLHCTQNYDGQLTDNSGIHSRYETSMMARYLDGFSTPAMSVSYYPNTVDEMFGIITVSWSGVSTILNADTQARRASGGSFDSTYYAALWLRTSALTHTRVDSASVMTASFVYSAWVAAGRPAVPDSSALPGAGPELTISPNPCPLHSFVTATIRYSGHGPLDLDVYDVTGAHVANLVHGATTDGRVRWTPGGAHQGQAAGVYFLRLSGPGTHVVKRLVFLG